MGRYTLENLVRALKNPSLFYDETDYIGLKARSLAYRRRNGDGIQVMERDWDNLFILDACRFDVFAEQIDIKGELDSATGFIHTPAFIEANFVGKEFHDTVYVTSNPHLELLESKSSFYAIESAMDRWDPNLQTVHPEDVMEVALEAREKYDQKRIIVHFMQPHLPFIGPSSEELRERFDFRGWGIKYLNKDIKGIKEKQAAEKGIISAAEFRTCYEENLEICLPYVEELVEQFDGKSVISADHGEMLGERLFLKKRYGHGFPPNEPLCRVPWFVIESDRRRKIVEDEPIEFEPGDEAELEDQLEYLGYV